MRRGAVLSALLLLLPAAAGAAPTLFESAEEPKPRGDIDAVVFRRLREQDIQPAKRCSDVVFVRRVYLDVIGTLPTAAEAKDFLADRSPDKRRVLIDRLLEHEAFADYWAMHWSDLLRVKAEFPINLWPNAAQAYHRWIRTAIAENMPYDRFVRELLTSSGSNFRVPQVNFYRALQSTDPPAIARAVALAFMGTRADKWPEKRLEGMAAFFAHVGYKRTAEWKEEIVYFDAVKAATDAAAGKLAPGVFPDGKQVRLTPDRDPRAVFADWLIDRNNPWFARALVNRVWFWLMGRGVVHEPDDIRPDNPPKNPELLAILENELVAVKYDPKAFYRRILNSATYQLAPVPRSRHTDAGALFAYYPIRRLDAEVLIDALCQITGTKELYSSLIPEPFTFIPEDARSIALPDGSISSPFLEMFGRPPRDTGLAAERNNTPSAAQRLHLLNSSHIRTKIEKGPALRAIFSTIKRDPKEALCRLYLTVLSRYPTEAELKTARDYAVKAKGPSAVIDLVWALINSSEFLYRH